MAALAVTVVQCQQGVHQTEIMREQTTLFNLQTKTAEIELQLASHDDKLSWHQALRDLRDWDERMESVMDWVRSPDNRFATPDFSDARRQLWVDWLHAIQPLLDEVGANRLVLEDEALFADYARASAWVRVQVAGKTLEKAPRTPLHSGNPSGELWSEMMRRVTYKTVAKFTERVHLGLATFPDKDMYGELTRKARVKMNRGVTNPRKKPKTQQR